MGMIKKTYNALKGAGKAISNAGKIITSAAIMQTIVAEHKEEKRKAEIHKLEVQEREEKIKKINNYKEISISDIVTNKEFKKIVMNIKNQFKEISNVEINSFEIKGYYSCGFFGKTKRFIINLNSFRIESPSFIIEKSNIEDDLPNKFCDCVINELKKICNNQNVINKENNKNNAFSMKCSCGFDLNPGDKFCTNCGVQVNQKTTQFCSKCGIQLSINAKFCSNCGNKVTNFGPVN